MTGKTCNRCGKTGLEWDIRFHTKMGKWKLENHRHNGVWCNKPKEILMIEKTEYELCPLCHESVFGKCKKENLPEHLKIYHPNGEVLTDLDWKVKMNNSSNYWLKYWTSDKHFYKYKDMSNK